MHNRILRVAALAKVPIDGEIIAERSFTVSGVAAAMERAGPAPQPATGSSGGGIR